MDEHYVLAAVLGIVVLILIYLKRTDYMVGCTKWREENGCKNAPRNCPFPNCNTHKEYKSVKWFS